MTIYLHMPSSEHPTLAGLNALRLLRDQLSAYAGVQVVATPAAADVEVQIVDVLADCGPQHVRGDASQYILVVRMTRNGERLDFVCSGGHGDLSAERQAGRRIRSWLAGEHFMPITRPAPTTALSQPNA